MIFFFLVRRKNGEIFYRRTTLPSSVRPGLPSAATRPLGRPANRAIQGRNKAIPPPIRLGQPSPPKTQDRGCRPRCDFYWPPLLPRSARLSSSLVFITRVTNDSISIHFCSDWSMRETIVSEVSCAPTARPTVSLSAPHLTQTKSVCSALSTRDPQ